MKHEETFEYFFGVIEVDSIPMCNVFIVFHKRWSLFVVTNILIGFGLFAGGRQLEILFLSWHSTSLQLFYKNKLKQIFHHYIFIESFFLEFMKQNIFFHDFFSIIKFQIDVMTNLLYKVIIFGAFVSIWWSCTTALMSLATFFYEKNGKKDLGPFQWMFYFSSVLISTFLYSSIKLGYRTQGVLSAVLNFLFFVFQFLAIHSDYVSSHVLVAVGGILGGTGNMLINLIMGRYLSKICENEEQNEKGHYFGIFNTIFLLHTFSSGFLQLIQSQISNEDTIFIIIIIVSFLNIFFAYFAIQSNEIEQNISDPETTCCQKFLNLLNFYPVMKNTIFLIVLDGLSVGVQSSTLLHILPFNKSDFTDSLALFGWGIGAFLSGYFSARITDLIQYKICGMIEVIIFFSACLTSYIAFQFKLLGLAFVAIFLWGLFTFSIEGFMSIMCCKEYKSMTEAFVINRQVRCVSETLYSTLNTVTKNSIPVSILMLGISIFCIPALLWLAFWKHEEETPNLMTEND